MTIRKIALTEIKSTLLDSYDLFICSSSYENRCLSVARQIEIGRIKCAMVLSNIDLIEYIKENKIKLDQHFGMKGLAVDLSTSDPLLTADNLDKSLAQAIKEDRANTILLDVTTFTHESLLILLRLLRLRCPFSNITVTYANASEYSLGDDVQHKWLSRGIGEVRSVLGYPGNIIPSQKTHLILIVGYEHERAAGLIESLEPNSIALGYGRSGSATTDKDKDANEHYMQLVEKMATSFADPNTFEIPCDDPCGTRDEIRRQILNVKGMNVLIAPMNNKLSTIGAAWACFANEDVQLCYAPALRYNYSNYSDPGHECYIFELNQIDRDVSNG
jgi:hypothetical protein